MAWNGKRRGRAGSIAEAALLEEVRSVMFKCFSRQKGLLRWVLFFRSSALSGGAGPRALFSVPSVLSGYLPGP